MKVSVLVHNFNRALAVDACLASVAAQNYRPLEVIVLDAGSTDGSVEVIRRWTDAMLRVGIETVFVPCQPQGVAASRNLAAAHASGDLLFFLDNDARVPDPCAATELATAFTEDPRLAVVALRVLAGDTNELDFACWVHRRTWKRWSDRPFETFTFTGGACCILARAFREAGGLWDSLQYSREEEDLSIALLDRGWHLRYLPHPVVRHHPAPREDRNLKQRRATELQNGLLVFWRRFDLPVAVLLGLMRATSMATRMMVRREGSPLVLVGASVRAAALVREGQVRRAPVSFRAARRYLTLMSGFDGARPFRPSGEDPVSIRPRRRVNVLGCPFDVVSFEETAERICRAVEDGGTMRIFTGNVDFVVKARHDPVFRMEFRSADLAVADGVPILWAARLLGTPLKGRVNGTDLVSRCAALSAERGFAVALAGGRPGVAEAAAQVLRARCPGGQIHAVATPDPLTPENNGTLIEAIRATKAKVLLLALGAPRQERWILTHLEECGANVGIGVGSALDLVSGRRARAPRWMQRSGLEWLHRLACEPHRLFRRYIVDDMPFCWWVAREAIARRVRPRQGAGEHGGSCE